MFDTEDNKRWFKTIFVLNLVPKYWYA